MTVDQAEALFGETGEAWEPFAFNSDYQYKCWVGDGIAYVIFDESGRLCAKQWHEYGFASHAKERFALIRPGMSQADVHNVLGRPPESGSPDYRFQLRFQESWHDIDGVGSVNYLGGRVHEVFWFPGLGDRTIDEEYDRRRQGKLGALVRLFESDP